MNENLKYNYLWVISGLEVFILGMIFLSNNRYIDRPPHAPSFVSLVDDPPFAIFLMFFGGLVVAYTITHELKGLPRDLVIFFLSFVWFFYFFIFAVHDITGPFNMPGLKTMISLCILLRTMGQAYWSTSK
ncbi:hypothetical protein [Companilactobacillus mishanensis]|uniref:Uncharacterized protein n=1 Tax=Companilactobacillus mishanensis TaxID=2486008 RepID=A0A5P0ZF26_9LACO|nr:hypothetical protein [Companilactobacillus mishanensis]MQS44234.1 hypothetical protein [Companilactobacillus mishanensis]MQS51661.1 hypothetical protein [Companilactobacillus mishanensis]